RGPDRCRGEPGALMLLARTDTLAAIRAKVEAGERLDFEDGVALMESDDLLGLGELADLARRQRGGDDRVFFVQNLYLNQTNVCRVKCKFCAFAVTQKQADAYTYSPEQLVEDAVRQHELSGFTEIHMVACATSRTGPAASSRSSRSRSTRRTRSSSGGAGVTRRARTT